MPCFTVAWNGGVLSMITLRVTLHTCFCEVIWLPCDALMPVICTETTSPRARVPLARSSGGTPPTTDRILSMNPTVIPQMIASPRGGRPLEPE